VKVLFFARLREALGAPHITLSADEQPATVADLRALLAARPPAEFADAIADPNVICAVNQRVADPAQALCADDEVAFFPPVTGG
jgi:molybdopterin synthase sulfur carrier subunit